MPKPKKTPEPKPAHPEAPHGGGAKGAAPAPETPVSPDLDSLDHTSEFVPFDTRVPLSRLRLSGLNVRHTERDADVASLAEDIAARGLKTNLNVIPAHFTTAIPEGAETNFSGLFEVAGGGRRTQAMQLLASQGRLPADHLVSVKVEPRGEARETSLSENLHRVAMNPADEFEAFAQIAAQHMAGNSPTGGMEAEGRTLVQSASQDAVAYVAKRFGVTQRHVQGRLRLASLAPEVLEALRTGTINLDSAKAYAGTTDHKLQLKVFKAQEKANYDKHGPRTVREALRGGTLPLSDGRVIFVGLDAYRAAGGSTEVEMFMGSDGEERATDLALLDRLCAEQAQPMLAALAKADGYASGLFAPGRGWQAKAPKPPAGFVSDPGYEYTTVTAKTKAKRIAIYTVARDGSGLTFFSKFKPEDKGQKQGHYRDQTPEERYAARRQVAIDLWAARLAVGPFAGTPLEGKAFWPRGYVSSDERIADSTDLLVSIQIRVTAEDIEARRAEAEAKVDKELAEEAARAAQADRDEDDQEDDDSSEFDETDLQTENDDGSGEA